MNTQDFPPVPPPLLGANEIKKNRTTVPNSSGIYFIWEGSVVVYVGQTINLAQRLSNHLQLRRSDKISYLCIDSSELFYHEAFYIGICRPTRNGGSKRGTRKTRPLQKYMKMRRTHTQIRQYADGRWGYDDYSSGKRIMVRLWSKEKAEKRAANIALQLTNPSGELVPANEFYKFKEWKTSIIKASLESPLSTPQYAFR